MEETMNSGAKFCDNCGAPIQPGQKFCDNCGQKIVYTEAPAAAPVPAEEPQQYQGFPEEPQEQAQGFPEEPQEQTQGFPEEPQEQAQTFPKEPQEQNSYQQNSFQQNTQQGAGRQSSNAVLPPRLGCAIAYFFSLLGCIVLYFLGDREDDFVRHHLNQAIVLGVLQVLIRVLKLGGLLGSLLSLFVLFGWVVGMYGSVSGKKTEIPLISQVKIF